jgi:hypothetical protein
MLTRKDTLIQKAQKKLKAYTARSAPPQRVNDTYVLRESKASSSI